ncbi:hypothetical protein TUBRATIS_15560 [Tubulinosema ratisbonensis]|uniref:Uncharacterized protein n=1 Tax=Tubulinosema ratisbonensis TaxID=291195 RepID=A0A437AL72_9MICR|nr:hypothetical protein TUBRATIS_15560 [Tubulinosema ratisbonensis]
MINKSSLCLIFLLLKFCFLTKNNVEVQKSPCKKYNQLSIADKTFYLFERNHWSKNLEEKYDLNHRLLKQNIKCDEKNYIKIIVTKLLELRNTISFKEQFFMSNITQTSCKFITFIENLRNCPSERKMVDKFCNYVLYVLKHPKFTFNRVNKTYSLPCVSKDSNMPVDVIKKYNDLFYRFLFYVKGFLDINYSDYNHMKRRNIGKTFDFSKEDFEKLINSKDANQLFKFCDTLNNIFRETGNMSMKKYESGFIHYILSVLILKYKALMHVLFKNETNIWTKQYIPLYKLKILKNLLLEIHFYLHLLSLKSDVLSIFGSFILLKSVFLFAEIEKVILKLNYSDITLKMLEEKEIFIQTETFEKNELILKKDNCLRLRKYVRFIVSVVFL